MSVQNFFRGLNLTTAKTVEQVTKVNEITLRIDYILYDIDHNPVVVATKTVTKSDLESQVALLDDNINKLHDSDYIAAQVATINAKKSALNEKLDLFN